MKPDFFPIEPKKGMPISISGFAAGLAAMARALENLNIEGGAVEWQGGVPTIIPPEYDLSGGAETETCYVLRKATAADVAAAPTLVEGQWLISKRTFAVGTEESYEATVPHTCPVVTT